MSVVKAGVKGRSDDYMAMCRDPTIANVWKCRVLVGIEYEESESPQFAVVPIKDINERKKSEPYLRQMPF